MAGQCCQTAEALPRQNFRCFSIHITQGKLMSKSPEALWLNVSPSFQEFDRPLLQNLSKQVSIARWEYYQTQDEPTSVEAALVLLHDYLQQFDRPIHLLGHSTSGLLGLLYARQYPERVKSLTLLSVGVYPAVDWQAHYYIQLQLLPCSRETILRQMVYNLFGNQRVPIVQNLVKILDRDLLTSLSPHSLFQRICLEPAYVFTPLLVCGSEDDIIVDLPQFRGWEYWLKEGDCLWHCPTGRYFFHYFYPKLVTEKIVDFWSSINSEKESLLCNSRGRRSIF